MHFQAAIKSGPTGGLKGTYKCTVTPAGLELMRKKETALVIPRPIAAMHAGGSKITIPMPTGPLTLAISKFPAYPARLANAVAAYLRGERELKDDSEFKVEPYLLIPAVLPIGIMILTRGGAIWGALGGGVVAGCLAISQLESLPRMARLGLILLINAILYAIIIMLVVHSA